MLVLRRKPGEKVVIGNGTTLTITEVQGNRVRVGIDALDQVRILRSELVGWEGLSAPDLDLVDKPQECTEHPDLVASP
jgi:carbon storage regulator CsrA